ncbi:methyl-accepting chemotaxis protein [Psychrobacillus vulpis]|uniref:Methyl-accepting chemotaxis protein n=1 Tax=Psychrobacillus vulpis TaxID=2325572 RepID=A0A544TW00_9BACI|nr:methyl-accepting chemotaxis protein [Psychrobacillus vulpis]TQR21625.1 methyl-accepting chemotaxis protein [Psychrobacillus vulpis]
MRFLKNLKIKQKLLILIAISMLSSACIGIIGLIDLGKMEKNSIKVFNEILKPTQWLGDVRFQLAIIDNSLLSLTLTEDVSENARLKEDIDASTKIIIAKINEYRELELLDREKETLAEYDRMLPEFKEPRERMIAYAEKNENTKAYEVYINELKQQRESLDELLLILQQSNIEYAQEVNQQNQKDIDNATIILVVIFAISIVVTLFISFVILKMIVSPTNELKELLSKAEEGDFTVQGSYQSKDELGALTASFNKMISGVRGIIQTVADTSQQVAAASEELTASAEQTAAATNHVASAIEEIATGAEHSTTKIEKNSNEMQDVLKGINEIADGSAQVSEVARETSKEAEEGNKIVENNLHQMSNIHASVQKSHEVISSLSQRSNEVGQILDVINDIAAQTNLLALNAAIEAARAGEHGKGFAVVADEVRKLAEQSLSSTKLIAEIITSIQNDSNQSVKYMGEVMTNAKVGMEITTETADKFVQILEKTRSITPQIEGITSTVQDIVQSIETVSGVAEELAAFAQENASSSEEVAASTEQQLASMEEINSSSKSLAKMAEQLNEMVSKFKI